MKLIVLAGLLGLIGILYVGYYNEVSDGEVNKVFFLKKSPTLRVQFFNIHANDGDYRKVENLTDDYRQKIIDYCKYRLGIETDLKNQTDIEMCSKM